MSVLNPCPWCGQAPEVTRVTYTTPACYHIDCRNPDCSMNLGTWYYYKLSDAVEEWNKLTKVVDK